MPNIDTYSAINLDWAKNSVTIANYDLSRNIDGKRAGRGNRKRWTEKGTRKLIVNACRTRGCFICLVDLTRQ